MGLTDIQDTQIGQLSGGQQQRAFIARALASDANILLLDEPFTGVDAKTTDDLIRIFQKLKNQGKTVVLVHHDLANAKSFLDHVILLKRTLLKSGDANEVLNSPELVKAYGFSFQPCRN
jgi:manganese/zinc/iron transport system ATP- binding protein